VPVSDEALDYVAKTMVTKTTSKKIDDDMKPGRGRSDVIRDAIEFFFEYRDRILRSPSPKYRSKKRS
jgi:hypothetical protein